MYQQIDPSDPNVVYTESQGGNIVRFDRAHGDRKAIKPYPPDGDEEYRFHWTAPIAISLHDSNRIYLGGNRLFTSTDRGETWAATEDLTRAEDRDTLEIMGVRPDEHTLSRHDGVSDWGTNHHDRRVACRARSDVGRNRRWPGATVAGRGADVDEPGGEVSRFERSRERW